jgi:peptidoglycan/xylan/chitin deacetylase (PgdA/CDA1 family)
MSRVLVLCYHGVSETWEASEAVSPDVLERQLTHLVRRGWRAQTFREAVAQTTVEPTFVVTFDDALVSVKRLAVPILHKLGVTATVFAPTAYVTSGERCGWQGVAHWLATSHADELTPMSWNDLGELADDSWEIASHTCTHPRLTELDDASLAAELEGPLEASAAALGRRFETIAYPYGGVDDRVAEFSRRAGYTAGAALDSNLGQRGRYQWPRTGIYRRDAMWRFRLKVAPGIRTLQAARLSLS